MRSLLLALLFLLAPACAFARTNENEPVDPELLQALRPGTTTAGDVVQLLGAPVDVVQLGKRSAYLYRCTSGKHTYFGIVFVFMLYNSDTRSDRVWVFFDENEVLTHVGATLESNEVEYAMPWEDVHD